MAMDRGPPAYRFKVNDRGATQVVVEAVAFLRGVDPLDLDPLGTVVDPDALDTFVSNSSTGTVSFAWEDVSVDVHVSGDVVVTQPDPGAIPGGFDAASNVLVLDSFHRDELYSELASLPAYRERNVLRVVLSGSDSDRVEGRDDRGVKSGAQSVGERSGSLSGTVSIEGDHADSRSVEIAPSDDLVELGISINDCLADLEADGEEVIIYVESLTGMLGSVDRQTAFKFLRLLTDRVRLADATAFYRIDHLEHDVTTLRMIRRLFDLVI